MPPTATAAGAVHFVSAFMTRSGAAARRCLSAPPKRGCVPPPPAQVEGVIASLLKCVSCGLDELSDSAADRAPPPPPLEACRSSLCSLLRLALDGNLSSVFDALMPLLERHRNSYVHADVHRRRR